VSFYTAKRARAFAGRAGNRIRFRRAIKELSRAIGAFIRAEACRRRSRRSARVFDGRGKAGAIKQMALLIKRNKALAASAGGGVPARECVHDKRLRERQKRADGLALKSTAPTFESNARALGREIRRLSRRRSSARWRVSISRSNSRRRRPAIACSGRAVADDAAVEERGTFSRRSSREPIIPREG